MERSDGREIDVLIVEDDDDYANFLSLLLRENAEVDFRVNHLRTLTEAVSHLKQVQEPVATLLDLGLPDSHGLKTVRESLEASPSSAVIVLTATSDEHLAQKALELGAQEYLVKDKLGGPLLVRAIRYAMERQHLLNELREAKQSEARERELRRLERLSTDGPVRATAAMYGNAPLHERAAERLEPITQEYGRLLDRALEERAFRSSDTAKDDLRSMAQVLGFLAATPRDVVRMHAGVLRDRIADSNFERAQAYVEEGRVHVLELMGYLASYYRTRAMGTPSAPPPPAPDAAVGTERPT